MVTEILNKALPKWPALTVIGRPITHEQACEVIIRTQNFYFSSNDRNFKEQIESVLDIPQDISYPKDQSPASIEQYRDNSFKRWDKIKALCIEYRCLEIEYLQNHRIMSSYIGGPYGWCDWNGRIYCDSYNVGKWPSCEAIYHEWLQIAKAFPFLILSSQLWSGESCEDDIRPIIQFDITNGKVVVSEPTTAIHPVNDIKSLTYNIFTDSNRERGCTIKQFEDALAVCRRLNT